MGPLYSHVLIGHLQSIASLVCRLPQTKSVSDEFRSGERSSSALLLLSKQAKQAGINRSPVRSPD
jgi:hypothetical protein